MKNSRRLNPNHGGRLSELLNELQRVHRDDVKLYTSGHLNPNKLFNPIKPTCFWSGSLGPIRKRTVPIDQYDEKSEKMEDALSEFTFKTALMPAAPGQPEFWKAVVTESKSSLLPTLPISDIALEQKLKEDQQKLRDEMFKKDLRLPELRLLKYKPAKNSRQCLYSFSARDEYQFISSYLSSVTKKDKFLKFLQIEKEVVAKQDLIENDFTGSKVAISHEKKLEKELQKMNDVDYSQSNRLQVFHSIFDDICNSSFMYGDLLKEVKNEYELYIAILLDSQSSIHKKTLLTQVKGIENRTMMTSDIEEARNEVKRLVKLAKEALDKNEELRKELELEEEAKKTKTKLETPESEITEEQLLTLTQKIEEKRCQIFNKWDEIYALEKDMKDNFIHVTLANISEDSIKSIVTETAKLDTLNGILKKKILVLDFKIKENLEKCRLNAKEQWKFWDFFDTFKNSKDLEECY